MNNSNKHVVFDVVGTLVDYDVFYEAIEARLGPKLRAHHVGARIFGYAWMEAGEKEYTYLSMSGQYVPYFDVFRAIFYRTLWQAGLAQDPREFATDDDDAFLLAAYRALRPSPGVVEGFQKLREGGCTVWALTRGDVARVSGYLRDGGVDFRPKNFVSCDAIGVGKPAAAVYEHVLKKFPTENPRCLVCGGPHVGCVSRATDWVSCHRSILCTRKIIPAVTIADLMITPVDSFKGAWVSLWEKEMCPDIFGDMDVMADSLPEMADGIVALKG